MRIRTRFRCALLALALASPVTPAMAQPLLPPPRTGVPELRRDPDLTPEQAERLHAGVLEVRQLERTGDRPGAIARAVKLRAEFPGNRRVEDILLSLYRMDRRDDEVIKLLRDRTKRDGQDVEALRELASLLVARDQLDEAQKILDEFIIANPQDERRYRIAATLLASRGNMDAAADYYRRGRRAIGVESLYAAELSQIERQRGNLAAALGELMLLAEDPERRPRAEREIEDLIDDGGSQDAVIGKIEEMRKKHPKSAPMHDIAATAYLQMSRLPQALDAARQADAQAGDQGEYLLDFGRRALATTPNGTVDLDRARAGVQALQTLVQRHPGSGLVPDATRMTAEGLVQVARELPDGDVKRKMLEEAVQAIESAVGKLRSAEMENQNLALKAIILLQDLAQPREALAAFEQLAQRQRDIEQPDALIRVQIALCHAALGELDQARTVLQDVVRADSIQALPAIPGMRRPNQPQHIGWSRARFHLAELDVISGHYDEARATFAALAEQAPEDRLANDCLDLALLLNEMGPADAPALALYGASRQARLLHDRSALKVTLEKLAVDFRTSPLAPVALFELGEALAEEHCSQPAIDKYAVLLAQYKDHRLAPRSLEASGDLQLLALHRPDLAAASYERILTDYPDDLFLDGVRKKLLAARSQRKGDPGATP